MAGDGGRIAIVVPRYGEEILGGAETLARGLAENLVDRGLEVDVLTTCARDHFTWHNYYRPGSEIINHVHVRRFPVNRDRGVKIFLDLSRKIATHQELTTEEQYGWIDEGVHSASLYDYIDRSGGLYDLLIFVPYLFGTTYYGSTLRPEKSIIWPCLHDEPYAYFEATRTMLEECRGIMFNSWPEMEFAKERLRIVNDGMRVIGFGFHDLTGVGVRFRKKYRIRERFIVYSGRLEAAKNLPLLVSYFTKYKDLNQNDLLLILTGTGPEILPGRRDIMPLGFMQEQEKLDAYAAATILCQPSVNESFSIVLMEAWLSEVPVLVHDRCAVTKYHCQKSNGGLYFGSYEEFEECVNLLLERPDLRRQMGANGRRYVLTNYNWDRIFGKFKAALESWCYQG